MFALHKSNFGSCLGPVHAEWPQDPFVTLNGCIVRLGILSQTLVRGDPVCAKQVPGQYQELPVSGTAFIPGLTNSYRGSFAHLLQWRGLNISLWGRSISIFNYKIRVQVFRFGRVTRLSIMSFKFCSLAQIQNVSQTLSVAPPFSIFYSGHKMIPRRWLRSIFLPQVC